MMRLEIRYATVFRYPETVRESHNLLRARPATTSHQRLISYALALDPQARVHSYIDYWGTWVDAFGIRNPHQQLVVRADSIVEASDRPAPEQPLAPAAWQAPDFASSEWQYLQETRHTTGNHSVRSMARAAADARDGLVTIANVLDAVRGTLAYVPGSTYVGMDVNDVYDLGQGVCQDFVHLALSMYRELGIPARYVSGYFYAADQSQGNVPDPAEIQVQTHAWVEVAVPGWGWWAVDPTNSTPVGVRHIKIGHGRDYDDVLPLRGVYHGRVAGELDVSVKMSREQMTPFAPPVDQ